MNFWNVTVLVLTFAAPTAAVLLSSLRGRKMGGELRACMILFGVAAVTAAAGVARFDRPVRMEFLWPLTLEQSGYFEFTLQLLWSRYVWIFFTAALLLGLAAYDGPARVRGRRPGGLAFLTGTFFSLVLAFLSENILLSLFFAEIGAFTAHVYETGEAEDGDTAPYFKRSCFIFLGLAALLGVALSRQLASSSIMLLGAVLYLVAILVSRHTSTRWSQIPVLLLSLAAGLFLLERVMADDVSPELWIPLAGIFGLGTVCFACLSLIAPDGLGGSFWMCCTVLGYLLFLRFSSAKPGDPFWGAYEAIGLGAAYAISQLTRFGGGLDLAWKRILGFIFLALVLVVASGAVPTVEASTIRFDSETSLPKIAMFGLLTFLIGAVSGRGFSSSFAKGKTESAQTLVGVFGPAFAVLLVEAGMLLRWNELNLEGLAAGGLAALLADLRSLLAMASVAAGLLSGGLLGTNGSFAAWTLRRDPRMEKFFPAVDPSLVREAVDMLRVPEKSAEWVSARVRATTEKAAGALENFDRGLVGERVYRRLADSSVSLSEAIRLFHSGQARAYLFLGVLVTLAASAAFLWEGR
jgi:hypothetical protein